MLVLLLFVRFLFSFGGATFIYYNPNGSGGYDGLIVAAGATLTQNDVLVTGDGHRVLTGALERSADEVEALMAG